MEYAKLVDVYEYLEKTSSRLKKTEAISNLLKETGADDLERVVLLLQGKVYPSWDEKEIGIATQLMIKIISSATGFSESKILEEFKEKGDLGLVAEKLVSSRKQMILFKKRLTVEKVFENLRKIAEVEGKGAQTRKANLVSELLVSAEPKEAKYIVRTILEDLRVGVAEGIVRDAIAEAFFPTSDTEKKKEAIKIIEWAWFLLSDYGEVAKIAKTQGLDGLKNVKLQIGKPVHVLLAEKAPSLKDALEAFERPAIEVKFDGARAQIHKKGDKIYIFTRRLENITKQFPDVIEYVRKSVLVDECVIEGEIVAINTETGRPMPFQILSQRIHRKYDIDKMVKEIPVQVNLFDIIYLNGKMLFDDILEERRKKLESAIKTLPGKFQLTEQLRTKDLKKAEEFYRKALEDGQEGVMVKNLDAIYQPGRRVAGGWLKVKPIMESLDLVIIGATWGTGKRAGFLSSFVLACREPETGDFLECGMLGTGIKEKSDEGVTLSQLTELLKPHIVSEKGNEVRIRPKIVVEVAYEEIQKSPNYSSGYALRFPRIVRIRFDKSPEEADDISRIETLYRQQRGKK